MKTKKFLNLDNFRLTRYKDKLLLPLFTHGLFLLDLEHTTFYDESNPTAAQKKPAKKPKKEHVMLLEDLHDERTREKKY
jgi:hypothetical protein